MNRCDSHKTPTWHVVVLQVDTKHVVDVGPVMNRSPDESLTRHVVDESLT